MGTAVAIVFIIAVAVLAWLVLRTPAKKPARRPEKKARQPATTTSRLGGIDKLQENPDYWGVQIGQAGCAAARDLMGTTYPMDEAPVLPVDGCDSAMCTCVFKGLLNRRKGHRRTQEDRRGDIRLEEGKSPDRRSRKDRRRGNNWNDRTY